MFEYQMDLEALYYSRIKLWANSTDTPSTNSQISHCLLNFNLSPPFPRTVKMTQPIYSVNI